MATKFATDAITRTSTLWVAYPDEIILPPLGLSGRKDYSEADIASLAADILKRGQDTPALVRKNEAGQPVLVYGRRRYLAVDYINKHLLGPKDEKFKLECKAEAKMSDTEALIAAISENRFRKDVNDMDHCHNITQLMKRCKSTLEDVAEIYFPEAVTDKAKADAVRWVRERAGLVELAPEAAQAVRDGELKITSAKELAKLPQEQQRTVIAAKSTTLAGKTRIKVKDVKASKPVKSAAAPKAKGSDPDDVPFDAPARGPAALPALPANPVLAAAETMARALDSWRTDATEKAERVLITAHDAYRALVPFMQAGGKAA